MTGATEELADQHVADDEELWRRFPSDWWVPDENRGCHRLSRAAFQQSSDGSGMSVDRAKLMPSAEAALAGYPTFGLAMITARACREIELRVEATPLPTNLAHATVSSQTGKFSTRVQTALAGLAAILKVPDGSG